MLLSCAFSAPRAACVPRVLSVPCVSCVPVCLLRCASLTCRACFLYRVSPTSRACFLHRVPPMCGACFLRCAPSICRACFLYCAPPMCRVCFLHRVPPMCRTHAFLYRAPPTRRVCCLYAGYTPCGACFPPLCLLHTRLALPALCSVSPSCAPLRGAVSALIAFLTRHAARFQAAQRRGSKNPLHFVVEGETVPDTGYRSPRMRMMRIRMGSTHWK